MIALSYSRLSTYEQCPMKFNSQFLKKDYPDDSKNIHFIKGEKKHKQLQNYVQCKNDPTMVKMMYDGDVAAATKIVDALVDAGFSLQAELKLAVDNNFKPCDWFAKNTMYRAIIDVLGLRNEIAMAGDWKTGKYREYDAKSTGQLHLTSAVILAHCPSVEEVRTAYFFIEQKQTLQRKFSRDMMDNGLTKPFYEAFETVNADKEFAPKKNEYCGFCMIKSKCPLF